MSAALRDVHSSYRAALQVVARASGLPVAAVAAPRGWRARRARNAALYLARVCAGIPVKRLASVAALPKSTLQDALARLEDARDDPTVDDLICQLEEAFHGARAA